MRRPLACVLALASFAAALAPSAGFGAEAATAPPLPPAPTASAETPYGYRVRVPIGEALVAHGEIDGVPLDEIVLPGGVDLAPAGAPQIPTRTVYLRVPWGVEPRVRATPGAIRPLGTIRPTPFPKLVTERSERARGLNRDWREALASPAYATAIPGNLVRSATPMAAGQTRLLAVEIAPVQWEPSTGNAWQFEELLLDVSWERAVEPLAPSTGERGTERGAVAATRAAALD
ncbi:MAG: C25 family peptidase propeptide domain-containing protein, partial [Candidatus Eisenbacteria bacterium]